MEIEEDPAVKQEKMLDQLFENVMNGKWDQVVKTYNTEADSRSAKITDSLDTALHLAVSDGKRKIVSQLVESLGQEPSKILKQKNKEGNTPLHTAASLGDPYMCHSIASKDTSLIAVRNNENATPLSLAAHFGHKDAFLCLHFLYKGNRLDTCSRKANGDTILHAALKGESFDLAFEIIRKYPELVNDVNENGFTALHILATKPNAFKSGSRLGLFDKIIYQCIIVNEIKEIKHDAAAYLKRFEVEGTKVHWNAETYETCAKIFRMPLKKFAEIRSWKASCFKKNDEENVDPQQRNSNHGKGTGDEEKDKEDYLTLNYATFIQSLKLLLNLLQIVLGHGFPIINKIIKKKERHTWAFKVMNELMERTSLYKYNEGRLAKDEGESDITFDPRFTGAPQGVEAHGLEQHQVIDANVEQNSPSVNKDNKGSSNKEGIVAPMESFLKVYREGIVAPMKSFLKEYRIVGSVDVKSSKHAVNMAFEKKVTHEPKKTETPILIAARMGVTEMVKKILQKFPVSIRDLDANNKNVLLLAVENRQSHTFWFLIKRQPLLHEGVFRHRDNQGNNALHLAATYGKCRAWLIPGYALQLQWEFKWYKCVKRSIRQQLSYDYNHHGKTPKQIFRESHKEHVKEGSEWLNKTSESCSVLAAAIATVAFATSATIPGGVKATGIPVYEDEPVFAVFSISSLIALCLSVAALVIFLAILTSKFEEKDFANKLPWKLILGLTALFTSIAAIVVSFCAGHFFQLRDRLKVAVFPIYIVTFFPVFIALAQLPRFFDILLAIIQELPLRSQKEFTR